MIKKILIIFVVFIIATLYTNQYTHNNIENNFERDSLNIIVSDSSIKSKSKKIKKPRLRGGVNEFLAHMGKIEGRGRYETISTRGYLGLYQFHPRTLKDLGLTISADDFLDNPTLQDSVMIEWLRKNSRSLRGLIRKYNGTEYNGIYITKAGILAGAHLVGPGGVLSYFYPEKYQFKTIDGNGVTVESYMRKFSVYDLSEL